MLCEWRRICTRRGLDVDLREKQFITLQDASESFQEYEHTPHQSSFVKLLRKLLLEL
jgi:hypothetical protein